MTSDLPPHRLAWLRRAAPFLLGATVFALAYAQAPLYYSNQNQYFLHGLAEAGYGELNHDWLANTRDPTPQFTLLVEATYRNLDVRVFHVYYALLMGVYLFALVGLFNVAAGAQATPLARMIFVALVLVVHSALLRMASTRLLGVDYPWYLQAGLAGQYVLGPMLQPSCFGVLLLLSIYLFARGQPMLAVTCSSLGAVCHSTYLLPVAMLTIAYLFVLLRQRESRVALQTGAWALALVTPSLAYILMNFRPSSPEEFQAAQELMVHFRLPHHCLPALWFDGVAAAQVAWTLLGIALARGGRLVPVLQIAFVLGLALTLLQVATGSDTLALLFPWRISVLLMPAATALILARLALWLAGRLASVRAQRAAWAACAVVIVAMAAGGVAVMAMHLGFQERDEELALMYHVREHHAPGDMYLLPVQIPNLKATVRGAAKSDFKPLPTLQGNHQFIPLDLQRFRLVTGVPIVVDFKSIPYWDRDVLEWYDRLLFADQFYHDPSLGASTVGLLAALLGQGPLLATTALYPGQTTANVSSPMIAKLREFGVTHIVVPASQELHSDQVVLDYEDAYYRIYRLIKE